MSIGAFVEKERTPSQAEMQAALGPAYPLWERLVRFIEETYQLPGELSYGGKKYGWNLWYRKGGKSLVSIYPQEAGFTVQIVLGREQVEKVAGLELGEHIRTIFQNTPQLHDGRWLFIAVQDERDVQDIERILLVKRKPAISIRSGESEDMHPQLSEEQIQALAAIDTPTVCNAIEAFGVRGRVEGFLGRDVRCLSPELGVMTGFAVTAKVDASTPDAPPDPVSWEAWVRAMDAAPKPVVLVFQDVGPKPRRSAHCGEVMATLAKRLGTVGLVTDAGVRDILEVRALGFHYFAAGLVPSHGTTRFLEVNVPVLLDGVEIRPGDLIHGDINGVTTIPAQVAGQVAEAAQRVRQREAGVMAYTRDPDFSLEGFLQRMFTH